jgi:hypothetical protein
MAAIGRLQPFDLLDFEKVERPLSGKAEIVRLTCASVFFRTSR